MRKPRVVHRPVPFLDPYRLGAHLHHERLGDRPQGNWRGDAETTVNQAQQIHGRARERHGRMQSQPEYVVTGRGVEDRRAIAAGGMHHELSGLPGARRGQPGDQTREDVVGDRQQDQLGPRDDLLHRRDGYAGQQRRGPPP